MAVLREQILDGHLPGGLALREAELCVQLGVSRHTARVALSNLAHEGLLRLEPNRGAFVRKLSAADVKDCYRLRTILELTAAECLTGHPEKLGGVRVALSQMMAATDETPWTASRDADLAFHRALVDGLGSPRISHTFEALMTELRLCFLMEDFQSKDPRANAEEHRKILEVVEVGDTREAVALLRSHLEQSCEDALAALPEE